MRVQKIERERRRRERVYIENGKYPGEIGRKNVVNASIPRSQERKKKGQYYRRKYIKVHVARYLPSIFGESESPSSVSTLNPGIGCDVR